MANLTNDDKEFIQLMIAGVKAELKFNQDITNEKLDGVNSRLDKLNGRVYKTEEAISGAIQERSANREHQRSESERLDKKIDEVSKVHILNCPQSQELKHIKDKVLEIEKENFGKKEIIKFIVGGISIASVIILIILNLEKLIMK